MPDTASTSAASAPRRPLSLFVIFLTLYIDLIGFSIIFPLGPYLISHPFFKPAFKVLSHEDEPQIPFGVTRIEVRPESRVFGAIRPPGTWAADSAVGQGYAIARQDCFRCHNMGAEGGTMAGESWRDLAADAEEDGGRFRLTIRKPTALKPDAKMPAHSDYDDATLDALTAYFRTFAGRGQ